MVLGVIKLLVSSDPTDTAQCVDVGKRTLTQSCNITLQPQHKDWDQTYKALEDKYLSSAPPSFTCYLGWLTKTSNDYLKENFH